MKKCLMLIIAVSSLLVTGCCCTTNRAADHATKWEYRQTDDLREVNKLADEGWIVVNFAVRESGPYIYLLKRAKP